MREDLIDLQTQLAFQEEGLSQLSDVVARQQGEIERLRADLTRLEDRYREMLEYLDSGAMGMADPGNEKPPHY